MRQATVRTVEGLRVEATASGHAITLDEPAEEGGSGMGMTPMEAFAASLAGCSVVTLSMYARRKGWPLEGASVTATVEKGTPAGQPARIVQTVTLRGPLDEEQRRRLLDIAGKCPVHRIVEGPTVMEERLA